MYQGYIYNKKVFAPGLSYLFDVLFVYLTLYLAISDIAIFWYITYGHNLNKWKMFDLVDFAYVYFYFLVNVNRP